MKADGLGKLRLLGGLSGVGAFIAVCLIGVLGAIAISLLVFGASSAISVFTATHRCSQCGLSAAHADLTDRQRAESRSRRAQLAVVGLLTGTLGLLLFGILLALMAASYR